MLAITKFEDHAKKTSTLEDLGLSIGDQVHVIKRITAEFPAAKGKTVRKDVNPTDKGFVKSASNGVVDVLFTKGGVETPVGVKPENLEKWKTDSTKPEESPSTDPSKIATTVPKKYQFLNSPETKVKSNIVLSTRARDKVRLQPDLRHFCMLLLQHTTYYLLPTFRYPLPTTHYLYHHHYYYYDDDDDSDDDYD